ncbi:hypothetical protein BC835DRAFT_702793 [Cytidiella melzeri]|nr:hypothetical protein BC835DRAFT_702793 [Cytidiella melzeri]
MAVGLTRLWRVRVVSASLILGSRMNAQLSSTSSMQATCKTCTTHSRTRLSMSCGYLWQTVNQDKMAPCEHCGRQSGSLSGTLVLSRQ